VLLRARIEELFLGLDFPDAGVTRYLWDPNDTILQVLVEDHVREALRQIDGRVYLTDYQVDQDEETLTIAVVYQLTNTDQNKGEFYLIFDKTLGRVREQ
jgi:hypothetical protein